LHPKVLLDGSYYGNSNFVLNGATYEAGVFGPAGVNFTLTNDGAMGGASGSANDAGVILASRGTVINNGDIYGGDGIRLLSQHSGNVVNNGTYGYILGSYKTGVALSGSGTVFNAGLIVGYEGGVDLALGGVVRNMASGTIIGSNEYGSSYGVKISGAAGTVFNFGYISATAGGVVLNNGGSVYSKGTIIGDEGIFVAGPKNSSITNKGEILATVNGIVMYSEGKAFNNGYISASNHGIAMLGGGSLATIQNTGTIIVGTLLGDDGILMSGFGKVENFGTIYGYYGIRMDFTGLATNAGHIYASSVGIYAGGSVTAQNNGYITAGSDGIIIGLDGVAKNSGTIITYGSPSVGILATAPDSEVNNLQLGFVKGVQDGILLEGVGTVTNAGVVSGNTGVQIAYGGFSNAKTGIVEGYTGVRGATNGPLSVSNVGTIIGASDGIVLQGGGTVNDSGTIAGGTYAVDFYPGTANRLILATEAVVVGSVNGGGGVLELSTGAKNGTINLNQQFSNFDTIQIDAKSVWDLAGSSTVPANLTFINDGTVKFAVTDAPTINAAISGTGMIQLSGNTLALNGAVAVGQSIAFVGNGSVMQLSDPGSFAGDVTKFGLQNTIDLTGISFSEVTGTNFANGVLTIDAAGNSYTLTFSNPSTFGKDHFALFADGAGTGITLATPAHTQAIPASPAVMAPGLVTDVTARSPWISLAMSVTL
jgi:hypothetical protein